jgi:hypothetical protein
LLRKILALALFLLIVGRIAIFPRFKALRGRIDRAVNVTLIVLALVYGFELVRWYLEGK